MKWVLRILTGLSVLLCLSIVLLWARSYRVSDVVTCNSVIATEGLRQGRRWDVWACRGKLVVCRFDWSAYRASDAPPPTRWNTRVSQPADPALVVPGYGASKGWLGLRVLPGYWGAGSLCLILPFWMLVLASAALPFRGILAIQRRWVRRRRQRMGLCPQCAYDLRASKDRCPECGTEIDGVAGAGVQTFGAMNQESGK